MLQLQYYNSVLKNNHIGKILNNYKLKYSRLVNEIESKINEMMKLCLKDILSFLENLEEAADQKRKINDYDKIKRELELVKQKLKSKNYNEHKLKSDFELLQQENNLLKVKINSLNQKISNLRNLSINISQNINISQEKNYSSRQNKNHSSRYNYSLPKSTKSVLTPKSGEKNNLYILHNTSTEDNISNNKSVILDLITKSKIIKSEKSLENNDKQKKNNKNNNQKKKIVNAKKFINNNAASKAYKNISKNIKVNINPITSIKRITNKKMNYYSPRPGNKIKKLDFKNKKNMRSLNIKKNQSLDLELNNDNNYNALNTFNQSADVISVNSNIYYEDLGKNIYEAFDSELKELEQDEANIELLLEQLSDDDENEE